MTASGWHREDIKAAVRKHLGNLTSLSVAWGYHRASVSNAIERPGSPAIERRIAEALGEPPHNLWPDRWTPDGARIQRSANAANPSRSGPHPHRQKSEAA